MNDEALLKKLKEKRDVFVKKIDFQISEVAHRIHERWKKMPTNTLAQAKQAEKRRLLDCDLSLKYAQESIRKDLACVVSTEDPSDKQVVAADVWYNALTDIEWQYGDAGDHHEIDMRWMIATTNASLYNPIRKYQRKTTLEKLTAGRQG